METIIRFAENIGLQYIKIKKWVADVRKGADLLDFNALPGIKSGKTTS